MTSVDFVDVILARMAADDVSQTSVARACRLSQPHISRVLNKQLKLTKKTQLKLENWLNGEDTKFLAEGRAPSVADLQRLIKKLGANSPERRMHIMQLLKLFEALAGAN